MKREDKSITWIDSIRYRSMSDYDKSNVDVMPSFSDFYIMTESKKKKSMNKNFGLGVTDNDNRETE